VLDPHGRALPAGEVGEIAVRSAMSTSSYWNLPGKTVESFFPGDWFRPSDIGYLDDEGFLYYLDRATDRIETAAGTVYPHVVESVVLRHSAVANCGVVGVPGAERYRHRRGGAAAAGVCCGRFASRGNPSGGCRSTQAAPAAARHPLRTRTAHRARRCEGAARGLAAAPHDRNCFGTIEAGATWRAALADTGDRVLIRDLAGRTRTGVELLRNAENLAGLLRATAGPGARIGLWYENGVAALEAFLAVEAAGGTRVPVDPTAAPGEASAIFAAAGARTVVADPQRAALLPGGALVHSDDAPLGAAGGWLGILVEDDAELLLYPRAVTDGALFAIPLSYSNWRAIMRTNVALFQSGRYGTWGVNEMLLTVQQMMHGTGFVATFPFIEMGLPQVIAARFDAVAALDAIERFGVTATMVVPLMLARLTDAAAGRESAIRSLRHVLYGGAPVEVDEIRRSLRVLGPSLSQLYGRVEGGWPIAVLDIDAHRAVLAGDDELGQSCGRPIDEVQVRLRGIADTAASTGELCTRSPMISAACAGPDGWCSLGDVMQQDARGYLTYRGRLDRMINTGYHVYPGEIEAAILDDDGVAAAYVTGEPHAQRGETVVAYVVPAAHADTDTLVKRLESSLAARLAKYKLPRDWRFVETLPAGARER
jgi:acyl-CoA synthetase (AMP-forming)/AMP-acid ligase II